MAGVAAGDIPRYENMAGLWVALLISLVPGIDAYIRLMASNIFLC